MIGYAETHGGGAEAVPPLWQAPDAQECVDEDAEGAHRFLFHASTSLPSWMDLVASRSDLRCAVHIGSEILRLWGLRTEQGRQGAPEHRGHCHPQSREVRVIPPLKLPYFRAPSGRYEG